MSLRLQAFNSLKWSFFSQFGNQFISFLISVYLTRLLEPFDIGLMGMIYIFFSFGTVLIDSGLNVSLVRNKSVDDEDYSTVFYANVAIAILFYIILFFSAPYIAEYYNQKILMSLIRVQGLTLIISALFAVQSTIFTRSLKFKQIGLISIVSLVISGALGLTLAYFNFGVWSIVYMNIFSATLSLFLFWSISNWKPKKVFSYIKFRYHLSFGYKLLITKVIDAIFTNIYQLIIGKIYNPTLNGYYSRADSFKRTIIFGISTPLNSVLLPILSKIQDDDKKLKDLYILILQTIILIIAPLLTFCSLFAKPIFVFLFTDKWIISAEYFQILCLAGILYPIDTYMVSFLNVKGRTDLILKIEIIKKVILSIFIAIAIYFKDIVYLLWIQVFFSIASYFINLFVLNNILKYKVIDQLKNTLNVLLPSAFSSLALYLLYTNYLFFIKNNFLIIIVGFLIFFILNIFLIFLLNKKVIASLKTLF